MMILGKEKLKILYSNLDDKQFQPNGVDLRLKSVESFSSEKQFVGIVDDKKFLPKTSIVTPIKNKYLLKKQKPYIINLGEYNIPNGYIGLFYIRSSFMRMGCLLSSSVADMGYNGTLKMLYYNPINDVEIEQNERIIQMVLYEAEDSSEYNGYYQENKWLIDEDVLISVADDGLPITIFGKCVLNGGYLYCRGKALHLHIYEYYKGDIEEGFQIHHKNHNKLDNRIANLEKLTISEHKSHHNKGVYNSSVKNRKYDLPFGFTVKEKLKNGEMYYCFQYFDDENVRKIISDKRFDNLINKSIEILTNLKKDYSKEIENIKEWAKNKDLDILSFKRLEKNNLPKGCRLLNKKGCKNLRYEFYHPSNNFLGSSNSFNKAVEKAIENTDDELYKSYLIKRWLNKN